MKIACQSCQAKYTIADEKVVGKVVKIRCKKCGTTIVVNGQEGAAPERDEAIERERARTREVIEGLSSVSVVVSSDPSRR